MSAANKKTFGIALPSLFGAAGGLLNAILLWRQVPERIADFEPVIVLCGALHGGVLAACGVAGANLALRHERLRAVLWVAAGYLAGWISWVPTHVLIADKPLFQALVWPFTFDHAWEAAWRPFQYFGLVGLLLAVALTVVPETRRRSPLALRAIGIASGILGSLWFWGMFQAHARMAYVSALHGSLWGLLVGAGLALSARRSG